MRNRGANRLDRSGDLIRNGLAEHHRASYGAKVRRFGSACLTGQRVR